MNDKTVKYFLGASISIFVAASLAAIAFPWRDSSSSSNNDDCSTIEATDPDLEGWLIEICGDGTQTWISPEGKRCVANEASSGPTTGCSGEE